MTSRSHRTRIARRLAVAAAALAVVAVWAACGRTAPVTPAPAGGVTVAGSRSPAATPSPLAGSASPAPPPAATTPIAARLLAACTVARLVRFVDRRRFADARRLLARPRCRPCRELAGIRHIDLISARVRGGPGPDAITIVATVRLFTRRGAPLPSGRTTLFFTLGRVRSAGDWLITAVTTSP